MRPEKKIEYRVHIVGLGIIFILAFIWYLIAHRALPDEPDLSTWQELTAYTDSLAAAKQKQMPKQKPKAKYAENPRNKSRKPEKPAAKKTVSVQEKKASMPTEDPAPPTQWQLELNAADSSDLVGVRGIGPYYAHKILVYRDRLGGFANKAQLTEIEGIAPDRLAVFQDRLRVDSLLVKRMDFNTIDRTTLGRHPYVGPYLARSILLWRQTHTPGTCTLDALVADGILSPEAATRLQAYAL